MLEYIKKIKRPSKEDFILVKGCYYSARIIVPVIRSLKKHDVRVTVQEKNLVIAYEKENSRGYSNGFVDFKSLETNHNKSHVHVGEYKYQWDTKNSDWKRVKAWVKIRNLYKIGEQDASK